MKARPASSADLEAVLAIQRSRPALPRWNRDHFEAELASPRSLVTVVEDEGRVLAFCVCLLVPPEAQLLMIAVIPERAGAGVGGFLLKAVLEDLRLRFFRTITLEVSGANLPALGLYRSFGFVEVGRRSGYYPDGSEAVLMDLSLIS